VNGRVAHLGESADPERDRIELDGRPIQLEPGAYWLLHKPAGVVTTRRDPEGRPTVLDLLPREARRARLFPVGRLDRDSEGLVLLTNDGPLAQRLQHPSFGSEKEYLVTVRGRPASDALRRLADGLPLESGGRPTAPARIELVGRPGPKGARLRIVLHEGRRRQLRRALARLGHPVLRLVRLRIGPLRLAGLPPGAARPLSAAEQRALRAYTGRAFRNPQLPPEAGAPASESRPRRRTRQRSRNGPESR
jgi:23S rRNA pseudouridine2605 synthase